MPCREYEAQDFNDVEIEPADVSAEVPIVVPLAGSRSLYLLAGMICPKEDTFAGASEWKGYHVQVRLPAIGIPWLKATDTTSRGLRVLQGHVTVGLARIENRGTAVNAGWAVDSVARPQGDGIHLVFWMTLGVRDRDGFIHRLNYQANVLAQRQGGV